MEPLYPTIKSVKCKLCLEAWKEGELYVNHPHFGIVHNACLQSVMTAESELACYCQFFEANPNFVCVPVGGCD